MSSTQNAAVSGSLRDAAFDSGRADASAGLVSLGLSSSSVPNCPDLDVLPSDSSLTPELALARVAAGYQ